MDEFALCWNNFQDNIATGFQNLFDRGDLVDMTIAVEGKLIQAHKIVLAICSPYFQEMFQQNPCKHPIIILKDVSYSVMTELLQFMYQGEVNVKHTELQSFMKIAEMLQIKGLTTPSHQKITSQQSPSKSTDQKPNGPVFSQLSKIDAAATSSMLKRPAELSAEIYAENSKKQPKQRTFSEMNESSGGRSFHEMTNDSIDMQDEVFMPPIPQISMGEQVRYDLNNVKRETPEHSHSPLQRASEVNSSGAYNYSTEYQNNQSGPSSFPIKPIEFNSDVSHSDFNNSKGSHMDIPAVAPGEKWLQGKLQFMLSQRGKPLLVHDGQCFGIQYVRKDKKYWQCNLSRKYNCKARVTTTDNDEIIVTNAEHCHTEIRQHLRKDYKQQKMHQLQQLRQQQEQLAQQQQLQRQLTEHFQQQYSESKLQQQP